MNSGTIKFPISYPNNPITVLEGLMNANATLAGYYMNIHNTKPSSFDFISSTTAHSYSKYVISVGGW